MAEAAAHALTVSISAAPPLARTGIERAARRAGLMITTDSSTATIGAHLDEMADSGARLDVAVDEHSVTICARGRVDAAVWRALGRFTDDLLNGSVLT